MKGTGEERMEYILNFLLFWLMLIHLYLGISNLLHGIDKGYGHSYPLHSYVLIGGYLLIVLAADAFMLWRRSFEPAGVLRKYWGSAFAAIAIVLALQTVAPGEGGMAVVCLLLYAPYVALIPLLEWLNIPGSKSDFAIALVGAFCLLNWAVCRFAVDRENGSGTKC